MARFFWFTVEFGLVIQKGELRAFGAGILSSPGETVYSVESPKSNRILIDPSRDGMGEPWALFVSLVCPHPPLLAKLNKLCRGRLLDAPFTGQSKPDTLAPSEWDGFLKQLTTTELFIEYEISVG